MPSHEQEGQREMSVEGTQSKKRTSRSTRGKNETWQEDKMPSTPGEAMQHTEKCLKWLKTKMDHSYVTLPERLTPFRHSGHSTEQTTQRGRGKGKQTDQNDKVFLNQCSYEYLPVHNSIDVACAFCTHPISVTQQQVHFWKNPYTRKSWTPMCDGCARKSIPV